MILDDIRNAERYVAIHPKFAQGFSFLRSPRLAELADGRHGVDGDAVYAMVIRGPGRPRAEAKLEVHRRYIDIQFSAAGTDVVGWSPIQDCHLPEGELDVSKDMLLYRDPPAAWVGLPPGAFMILFPEDAHAPMTGEDELHKVVVKVAVD